MWLFAGHSENLRKNNYSAIYKNRLLTKARSSYLKHCVDIQLQGPFIYLSLFEIK